MAFQPPLYAWLEAIGLWLSNDRDPLASVLPSYVAGGLVVVLVYLHGRLWRGAGLGLTAAVLVGFNQNLLLRMQEATPTTLVVCGMLAALLAYGWHERMAARFGAALVMVRAGSLGRGRWPGYWCSTSFPRRVGVNCDSNRLIAPILSECVVGFAVTSLSAQNVGGAAGEKVRALSMALLALAIALAVALPWYILMVKSYGWQALLAVWCSPESLTGDTRAGLLPRLIKLAPVTLPLALFGGVRAIRLALVDESETRETVGGSFWVVWFAVAALAPTVWPSGPRSAFDLLLLSARSACLPLKRSPTSPTDGYRFVP